ncbi:hypothetical protein OF83DRAFT_1108357 [Amylostereum chailletii]|nr:hypothetical protein OF83DRAFT_1108357 [Amylostereum chailletii]
MTRLISPKGYLTCPSCVANTTRSLPSTTTMSYPPRPLSRRFSSSPPSTPNSSSSSPLPTQTFHHSIFHRPPPSVSLFESAAGGAHYSGVDPAKERRLSVRRAVSPAARRTSVHVHEEISAEELHKAVLDDLKELYEGRPTIEIMERRWSRDAEYEDAYCKCKGLHEVISMWYTLSHLFSKSTTLARRVLSTADTPDRLIFWQKQEYVMRVTGFKKEVESIVVVDLDSEKRIIRLVDQWDGKEPPTSWGASHLRRLNARVVPWLPWLSGKPKRR